MLKQKLDYTYCNTTDCIHRYGCKRYPENYENFNYDKPLSWIGDKDCKPNLNDVDCENRYDLLDRFRNSSERD